GGDEEHAHAVTATNGDQVVAVNDGIGGNYLHAPAAADVDRYRSRAAVEGHQPTAAQCDVQCGICAALRRPGAAHTSCRRSRRCAGDQKGGAEDDDTSSDGRTESVTEHLHGVPPFARMRGAERSRAAVWEAVWRLSGPALRAKRIGRTVHPYVT